MTRDVLLDLSVSDVHAPGGMSGYAAGYGSANGGPPKGVDLPHASLAIVRDETGRVLTVSRPEPPHEMSLPGGEVEPGEALDKCAMRELKEECGIDCHGLLHVCDIKSPTDGRTVHVFRVVKWSGTPSAVEPGTKIAWLLPHNLLRQAQAYGASVRAIMDAGGLDRPPASQRRSRKTKRLATGKDHGSTRTMAEISTKTRNGLPDESFALPAARKYPVHDAAHTRSAASRLAQAKKKGKISDADYATAHAAIAKAEKKFGIQSGETEASDRRKPMHHFQITADLANGGSLHVQHATMRDAGGVAVMPGVVIAMTEKMP